MLNLRKKLGDVEHSQPKIIISNTTFKKVKILHSGYRIDGDDDDKIVLILRRVKYNMVNGMLSEGDIINIKFKKDDVIDIFDKEGSEIRGAFHHNLTSWNDSILIELDPL